MHTFLRRHHQNHSRWLLAEILINGFDAIVTLVTLFESSGGTMAFNSLQDKKEILSEEINRAQDHKDLMPFFNSIDLNQMKIMLADYVNKNGTPSHEINNMYYSSVSLLAIISHDVIQSLFGYLIPTEIFKICTVCKMFNTLCCNIKKSATFYDNWLYSHPVLSTMFCPRQMAKNKYKIGYFLKTKYNYSDVYDYSHDDSNTFLIGSDKVIWTLCKKHKMKTELLGYVETSGDPMTTFDFSNQDADEYWENFDELQFEDTFGEYGKVKYGKVTEYISGGHVNDQYDISPVLVIKFPSIKWRKRFLSERK